MAHPLIVLKRQPVVAEGAGNRAGAAALFVLLLGIAIGVAPERAALSTFVAVLLAAALGFAVRPRTAALLPLAPVGLAVGIPWPLPALALATPLAVRGRRDRQSEVAPPTRRATWAAWSVTLVIAVVAAPLALLMTLHHMRDDHLVVPVPVPPGWVIVVVVLLLAAVNATAEELLWRGYLTDLLRRNGVYAAAVVVLQAGSFGLAHAGGLPGGLLGVLAATGLGVALGVVRRTAAGLAGCVAVHWAVDIAIFGTVANQVVYTGAGR